MKPFKTRKWTGKRNVKQLSNAQILFTGTIDRWNSSMSIGFCGSPLNIWADCPSTNNQSTSFFSLILQWFLTIFKAKSTPLAEHTGFPAPSLPIWPWHLLLHLQPKQTVNKVLYHVLPEAVSEALCMKYIYLPCQIMWWRGHEAGDGSQGTK